MNRYQNKNNLWIKSLAMALVCLLAVNTVGFAEAGRDTLAAVSRFSSPVETEEQPVVVVISGPSGVGKDTVIEKVIEKSSDMIFSISHTTREPRPLESGGMEKDGVHYHFISEEEFLAKIEMGEFAEYTNVEGTYYGTTIETIENDTKKGKDVVLNLDPKGAFSVHEKLGNVISIFIKPESLEGLEKRLRGRGTETEQDIRKRMTNAREQLAESKHYDYSVVNVDGELEQTVLDVLSIIDQEKAKVSIFDVSSERLMEGLSDDTRMHTMRVKDISLRIGKELGLSDEQMRILEYSVYVHDMGNAAKEKYPDIVRKMRGGIHRLAYEDKVEPVGRHLLKWLSSVAPKFAPQEKIEEVRKNAVEKNDYYGIWRLYITYVVLGQTELTKKEEETVSAMFNYGPEAMKVLDDNNISSPEELVCIVENHHDYNRADNFLKVKVEEGNISRKKADEIRLLLCILIVADCIETANNYERFVVMSGNKSVASFDNTLNEWLPKRFVEMEKIEEKRPLIALQKLLKAKDSELFDVIRKARGEETLTLMPGDLEYINSPMIVTKEVGKATEHEIVESEETFEERMRELRKGFRRDAEVVYFNLLKRMAKSLGISVPGLKRLVGEHLDKIGVNDREPDEVVPEINRDADLDGPTLFVDWDTLRYGKARIARKVFWVAKLSPKGKKEQTFLVRLEKLDDMDFDPKHPIFYDIFVTPVDQADRWMDVRKLQDDYKGNVALRFSQDSLLLREEAWRMSIRESRLKDFPWLKKFLEERLNRAIGKPFDASNQGLEVSVKEAVKNGEGYVDATRFVPGLEVDPDLMPKLPEYLDKDAELAKTEVLIAGHFKCVIDWRNPLNWRPFRGDRNAIRESLSTFLSSDERVEKTLKEIGRNVAYEEIKNVRVQYIRASQRTVLKVTVSLKDSKARDGPIVFNLAGKNVRTADKRHTEAFRKLKGTGLVPEFGEIIDETYYEAWVKGPTVLKISERRGLVGEEIRKIAETWIRVGRHLSEDGTYTEYPTDMNPANIMYKNSDEVPEFVVVDIYGKVKAKRKIPKLFIYKMMKYYVWEKFKYTPEQNGKGIDDILMGIYEGFDKNDTLTIDFLNAVLSVSIEKLEVPYVEKKMGEFIEKLENGDILCVKVDEALKDASVWGQRFVDDALLAAHKMRELYKQGKVESADILIGLDSGWIPEDQQKYMQDILVELGRLSKKHGLSNMKIMRRKGTRLAGALRRYAKKEGVPDSSIIIFGEQETLQAKAFDSFRDGTDPDKWAFFAGVELPEDFGEGYYIRLLEMLTKVVNIWAGGSLPEDTEFMRIVQTGKRMFSFILPEMRPVEVKLLKDLYKAQLTALQAA